MKIIYTDGSCVNNGFENATATWGYVVTNEDNKIIEVCTGKVSGKQNSNRAELMAAIKALQHIKNNNQDKYTLRTDYEALYLYCNGKSTYKSNHDLYKKINRLLDSCNDRVTVEKVEAHKSSKSVINFINGFTDKVAKKCADMFNIA